MTWADEGKYGWVGDWGEDVFALVCMHDIEADQSRQDMRPELVLRQRIRKYSHSFVFPSSRTILLYSWLTNLKVDDEN